MTAQLAPALCYRDFTNGGEPLAFGLVYSYAAGTSTPQATYVDSTQTTPNTNPIVLNARGEAAIWLNPALSYKFVVTDSAGNTIRTVDNIQGFNISVVALITQSVVENALYSQLPTPAEVSASVTPTVFYTSLGYPLFEGDIRRYGALTSATDNHAAINSALKVSVYGNAAYIPGGAWTITTAISVPAGASMYGAGGNVSQILCNGCNGLTFSQTNTYSTTQAPNCAFRDFVLIGSNVSTSTAFGIYSNIVAGAGSIAGVRFENIGIISFQTGAQLRGFATPTKFDHVFMYNVAQGFAFVGQSIGVTLEACSLVRGTMTATGGAGTAYGISFATAGAGETAQAIHIHACEVYAFDTNISAPGGCFEVQIEHCDLSYATNYGVLAYPINGGFVLRDCWIELAGGVSGTIGVYIPSQAVNSFQKVHILDNNIVCDTPYAGSIGVNVGNNCTGVLVAGNLIEGFDIAVEGATQSTGSGLVVRDNTINILSSVYSSSSATVLLNSACPDVVVGPNAIIQGVAGASSPTATWASTATASSTSNITVVAATSFPAGTWVTFDTTADGLTAGVSYIVLTSSGTTITVGAYSGASAISTSGAYSGNVFATPLPLNFTSATSPGLTFYGRGAFIIALSDPVTSGVCKWVASGKTVVLSPVSLTGSAGATTMTATGLPLFLAPYTQRNAVCAIENNSAYSYGMVEVSTAAALSFFINGGAAAFTNSGTKGLLPNDIVYSYA